MADSWTPWQICMSTKQLLGVKSGEWCHHAKTAHPHEHYGAHPPLKEEVFFERNQCTGFHLDDFLSCMVQVCNCL
jgi:hypothetical protein